MRRENPLGRNRIAVAAKAPREAAGFIEVTILSLAGLTMALILIAQGIGSDTLQLVLSQ